MICADAQNLVSSHASLPDWRGSQGNKLMRETNQDFAACIESDKMAEKKIKKVSASAASRWVLELDVKKQWLNYSEEDGYVKKVNWTAFAQNTLLNSNIWRIFLRPWSRVFPVVA